MLTCSKIMYYFRLLSLRLRKNVQVLLTSPETHLLLLKAGPLDCARPQGTRLQGSVPQFLWVRKQPLEQLEKQQGQGGGAAQGSRTELAQRQSSDPQYSKLRVGGEGGRRDAGDIADAPSGHCY